jgi:hypothetical protein
MAGRNVPVVIFPRYTTLIGGMPFPTAPIPVAAYSSIFLDFWHGFIAGGFPLGIYFNESNDGQVWTVCDGGPWAVPVAPSELALTAKLSKAWFQFVVIPAGGPAASVTCWAQGFFELRER